MGRDENAAGPETILLVTELRKIRARIDMQLGIFDEIVNESMITGQYLPAKVISLLVAQKQIPKVRSFDPILVRTVFNTPVANATDFFSVDLQPINNPTTFRIYIVFNTAARLDVLKKQNGVTVTEQLNEGINLGANQAFAFNIDVVQPTTVNFRHGAVAAVTVLEMIVTEIPSME